jgi:hypothetical protein
MCGCDYKKCRKDCKCPCHVHVEEASERYYQLGQSVGLEEAAGFLLKEATDYFSRGGDDEAQLLRKLSEEMKKKAKERHPGVPK